MLAKYWKQICFFILIVAILFNVTYKLMNKASLKKAITQSAQYIYNKEEAEENKIENE